MSWWRSALGTETGNSYAGIADNTTFNFTSQTLSNAPTELFTTQVSQNQIDLSWTDNSSNEEGFTIEHRIGSEQLTPVSEVGPNPTSLSVTGLSAATACGSDGRRES